MLTKINNNSDENKYYNKQAMHDLITIKRNHKITAFRLGNTFFRKKCQL